MPTLNKRQNKYSTITMQGACLLCAALFLAGCGGGGASAPVNTGPVTSVARTSGSLQFTLSASKSVYARGETIPLTFTVQNTSGQPAVISFDDAPFVAQITRAGQMILQFPGLNGATVPGYTIAPGASLPTTLLWDQTDSNEKQVPAGQYTISGFAPAFYLNNTDVLMNLSSTQVASFWQANYASNPIIITIR